VQVLINFLLYKSLKKGGDYFATKREEDMVTGAVRFTAIVAVACPGKTTRTTLVRLSNQCWTIPCVKKKKKKKKNFFFFFFPLFFFFFFPFFIFFEGF